jgi:hypothetical protein
MTTQKERHALLARQIPRLEKRLTHMREFNRRFVSARLIEFVLGITAGVVALFAIGLEASLFVFGVTFVAFVILVIFHQRTQRTIEQFEGWIAIRRAHMARLALDWTGIPPRPWDKNEAGELIRTPLEVDFDIAGERSLHHLLDTAVTVGGSQRLRKWLNPQRPDLTTIQHRQAIVQELTPAATFRDRLTLAARLAAKAETAWDTSQLTQWLTEHDDDDSLRLWVWLLSIIAGINLTLVFLNFVGVIGAWWVGSFSLYVVLSLMKSSRLRSDVFMESATLADGLRQLTAVFTRVENHHYTNQPAFKALCQPFLTADTRPSHRLTQVSRIVNGTALRRNPFLWMFLNAAVPWDYFFIHQLQELRGKLRVELPIWLDTWFEIEALCSLATFAYLNPAYTLPTVEEKPEPLIHGRALGHPLIPPTERICNDFDLVSAPQIVLITGSNMAGKSSFLRTVGLNLVLAYAGTVVCAQQLQTRPLRLFSAIKVTDSVSDGISYFYAEVQRLKSLLMALDEPDTLPLFFFIDEIFRGTNNRERLIGSRAFIRALVQQNGTGLISTHDLELVNLADETPYIRNQHFRETVQDGKMVFDYTLRPGPCPTTNALRIMALEGLPVAVDDHDQTVGEED